LNLILLISLAAAGPVLSKLQGTGHRLTGHGLTASRLTGRCQEFHILLALGPAQRQQSSNQHVIYILHSNILEAHNPSGVWTDHLVEMHNKALSFTIRPLGCTTTHRTALVCRYATANPPRGIVSQPSDVAQALAVNESYEELLQRAVSVSFRSGLVLVTVCRVTVVLLPFPLGMARRSLLWDAFSGMRPACRQHCGA